VNCAGAGSRDENWASQVASVSANPQNAGDLYYQPFGCEATPTTLLAFQTGHWSDEIDHNCDFIDPLSGAETPFQMPPLPSGLPSGASGAPWTNNTNSSTGAYQIGAVEHGGACTGQCSDPNGTYLPLVQSNIFNSGANQAYTAARSAPTPIRQTYTCTSGSLTVNEDVTVSGQAKSNSTTHQVKLSKVTYAVTNPTGTTATITAARLYVPDSDPTNTPYVNGSAAVASAAGWTAGHDSNGIYASFAGTLTVGPGQTITSPALSASYAENGPTGTKVQFHPGPGSITFSSPAGSYSCHPVAPVGVFAHTGY
jgi:hypothetical protein